MSKYTKNPSLDLSRALKRATPDYLACRDIRHLWVIEENMHIVEKIDGGELVERHLVCDRCQTLRRDRYLLNVDGYGVKRLTVLGSQYTYPEDYLMPEMGKADHPREVLRYEQFRRAQAEARAAKRAN
jgi:hypothetical protein